MSTGQEFMYKTTAPFLGDSGEDLNVPQPPLVLPCPEGAAILELPKPGEVDFPQADLREIIEKRKTLRRYSDDFLTKEELSGLLWLTQGIKAVTKRPVTLRTVPSAGARHAFETYLLVNRVDGLTHGLYRYMPVEHGLLEMDMTERIAERVTHGCYDQSQVRASAVTFLWVVVTDRMTWRYGERGYRYLHLDAGHVCQNLYLASEAIGCGVCAIAAFDDEELNRVLDLDGESMWVIYAASVGKRVNQPVQLPDLSA